MKELIKKSFFSGLVFSGTVALVGITYATISQVTSGTTLTATKFNEVINGTVPTGAVMAFYGTSCPSGWNKADGSGNEKKIDGTNGTLDLRGEFIRGLDDSRGLDAGRTLNSSQLSTEISSNYGANGVLPLTSPLRGDYSYNASVGYRATTGEWGTTTTVGYYGVRPRNIALLYCVKD